MVAADVDAAYATCLRLARAHYENFPVASWLMPRAARPHVAAIYAFARIADDFADEGDAQADDRLTRLDNWQQRLDQAVAGRVEPTGHLEHDAVFYALAHTLARFPGGMADLLSDLLSAFRQDVTTTRYRTWDDVLDYCRRSANPVGRLVLMVTGQFSEEAARRSDAVCTALQLTNFWQDLAIDWSRGRLYVPLDVAHAHGANVDDLDRRQLGGQWRGVMRDLGGRTRASFETGRGVVDHVTGRLRWELRLTWLGGMTILDRLAEADYDVFSHRPTLGKRDVPRMVMDAVRWRTGPSDPT